MNITEQIISKSVIDCDTLYYESFILYATLFCNSCWIQSDDGAIAAFIVPIVTITLVQFKLQLNCNKLIRTFADQLYIFGHYSKGIMAT